MYLQLQRTSSSVEHLVRFVAASYNPALGQRHGPHHQTSANGSPNCSSVLNPVQASYELSTIRIETVGDVRSARSEVNSEGFFGGRSR